MATRAARSVRTERSKAFFSNPALYLKRNHRIALRMQIVDRLAGKISGARILDLGCGNGEVSAPFLNRGNHVTMVDQSAGMIAEARRSTPIEHHSRASFIEADIHSFTPDQPCDLTLCLGVLAHVDCTESTLSAISRSLKPGGRCVLQLSNSRQLVNRLGSLMRAARNLINRSAWHYRPTPLPEVLALAEDHGLHPIAQQDHLLLLPGMAGLLGKWLVPYDRFVMRHPWLSRFGMDTILLLEKR